MTANAEFAERARQLARQSGRGPQRRVALCCALALDESTSIAGARRVLDGLDAIGQTELKHQALELLGDMITGGNRP